MRKLRLMINRIIKDLDAEGLEKLLVYLGKEHSTAASPHMVPALIKSMQEGTNAKPSQEASQDTEANSNGSGEEQDFGPADTQDHGEAAPV